MDGVVLDFDEMCVVRHILNVIAVDIVVDDDPNNKNGKYFTEQRSFVSISEEQFICLVSAMEKMEAFTIEGLKNILPVEKIIE